MVFKTPTKKFSSGRSIHSIVWISSLLASITAVVTTQSFAQGSAADLARKAQDPLADITALMTDNTIGFNQGQFEDTGYNFQLQPVKSFDTPYGFRLIARGIIPIVGAPPQSDFGFLGDLGEEVIVGGSQTTTSTTWGISDSIAQFFLSPKTESSMKWGIGPQVSLKTRTDDVLGGPGWGGGVSGVFFGSTGPLAWGGVVGQHWGGEGDFSVLSIQPIVFFNFESLPGAYLGYNNTITHDWKTESGTRWLVPLGLTAGKTFSIGGGRALDLSVGGYGVVSRPDGAPDWQLKFSVNLIQ